MDSDDGERGDPSAVTTPERPGARPREGEREVDIKGYDLERELGRGGMGLVVAAHERQLGRTVAVKRMHASMADMAERFRREAHLTARLQHPGIVPVYEYGEDEAGAPYYAMRLVEGKTLAAAIEEARTVEQRMALVPVVLQVADTIAYAHAQRVIHRDLKPNNIMLGPFGETLVVDWGIAKDLRAGGVDHVPMTGLGSVMGTPLYMAPEQAAGEEVDERTDVYALAAILYHVLAGGVPFTEPLATRAPSVPGALIAIVEKGMAELPEDRYASARELADDLRRFSTGQLVAAHRYTLGERAGRLARRYRNLLLALVAAIVAAGGVAAVMFGRVLDARDTARTERDAAIVERARVELGRDPSRVAALLAGVEHADVEMLRASARASGVADVRTLGVVPTAVAEIAGTVWVGGEDGAILVEGVRVAQLPGTIAGIAAMGENTVAWGGAQIVVFDGVKPRAPFRCLGSGPLWTVEPRVRRAICVGEMTSELLDLDTGARTPSKDLLALVLFDGARIIARDGDGGVHTYDATTLARIATMPAGMAPTAIAIAGERVVVARGDEVVAWDPASGALDPYPGVVGATLALAASDDGTRLAALQLDGTLLLFDARTRRLVRRLGVGGDTLLLGFEPGGARIALSVRSELQLVPVGVARRWRLVGHAAPVADIAWSARGPISVAYDGTLRAWHLDEPFSVPIENAIVQPQVVFGRAGDRLLVWDLSTLREVTLPAGPIRIVEQDIQVAMAAYTDDGAIVIVERGGRVTRDRVELGRMEPGAATIETTRDGDVIVHRIATGNSEPSVRSWNRAGQPLAIAPAIPAREREREVVADGSRGAIRVARDDAPPLVLRATEIDGVVDVAWSTKRLAVVTRDHVCLFEPDRSSEGYCLPVDRVGRAWFSPEGRYLVASTPGGVLVWPVP